MDRKKDSTSLDQPEELHWVLTKEMQDEAISCLFHKEEGSLFTPERGFLGIIHAGHGIVRRTLMLQGIVPQKEGWVSSAGHGLSFEPHYFSRALDVVSSSAPNAGLIIVHSHFGSVGAVHAPPEPSRPDLYHERRLLFHLSRALPPTSPVTSGILVRNGAWRIREYRWPHPKTAEEAASRKFGIDSASYVDASGFRIVSSQDIKVYQYRKQRASRVKAPAVDSTIRLWGKEGQEKLGALRIGIAGLGGVGSLLTEFLARLGVGELVLVDFDIVSEENLNRLIGARRDDVGKPKVEYASRIAGEAATANGFRVKGIRASVAEWEGLRPLLDADIIMNAADSAFARQVLDHASYAYTLPVIDGGTKLLVGAEANQTIGKSQVGKAGPGDPCLECCGVYSQEEATLARESASMQGPASYVQVVGSATEIESPRAPSVISFNSLVAALMVQRMLSVVLGFPPRGKHGQQRYYAEQGVLDWGPREKCKEDCPKPGWVSLGDSHPVPVGIDPIWKQTREKSEIRSLGKR
jgi:molybdopterin/thiamine biosynthesis adenylyltransferase